VSKFRDTLGALREGEGGFSDYERKRLLFNIIAGFLITIAVFPILQQKIKNIKNVILILHNKMVGISTQGLLGFHFLVISCLIRF